MAKVQIKSERITPFGGIIHVRELFSRFVGPVVDKVLGLRCTSFGYQYSEIAGSLASVYFCGGDSNLESEDIHVRRARMDCESCSRKIVETVEKHSEHFYIRANNCSSLYDSLLALRGWQRQEINGIEYELNSIITEKWEGKALSVEYLHGQQIISEPFCIHRRLKKRIRGLKAA